MPSQWSKGLAALTGGGGDAEPSEAATITLANEDDSITFGNDGDDVLCLEIAREWRGRVWKLKGNPTGDVWRMEKNPNSTDVAHGEGVPGTMTEGADILASYQVQPLRRVIGPYSPMT